jgi:hypothetical protein
VPEAWRHRESGVPAYDLDFVRRAFSAGHFRVTGRVERHLTVRDWDRETIRAVVASLRRDAFHKSQEALSAPGVWLDIYRPMYEGRCLYLKFMIDDYCDGFRVLTFCRDGDRH